LGHPTLKVGGSVGRLPATFIAVAASLDGTNPSNFETREQNQVADREILLGQARFHYLLATSAPLKLPAGGVPIQYNEKLQIALKTTTRVGVKGFLLTRPGLYLIRLRVTDFPPHCIVPIKQEKLSYSLLNRNIQSLHFPHFVSRF